MNRFYSFCLSALICLASHAANPIRIVFDNDVHCALDGYVALAGVRDSLARIDSVNTALVSSGDYLQGGSMGAISKGQYCIDMINAVRYDALALGNHEFDYQMPHLLGLIERMSTRPVCCNLYDLRSDPATLPLSPYQLKHCSDGRIVAFVGVTTPATMYDEQYSFYDAQGRMIYTLCPDSFHSVVQQSVDAARRDGADYVVLLCHVGENVEYGDAFTSQGLIAAITGIDVVLDAHSHSVRESVTILNKVGHPVLLSQTGTQVHNVGLLTIDSDRDTLFTQLISVEVCPRSQLVQHVLDSIMLKADSVLGIEVGYTSFPLTIYNPVTGLRAVRNAETNMGDLVTDALRAAVPGAQITIQNGGAIRKDIAAGTITTGNVIDVLSFCTMLWSFRAKGQMIVDFLEEACSQLPNEGPFHQVSGITMKVDTANHPVISYHPSDSTLTIEGPRRVFDVQVLQADSTYQPIDPLADYILAATDYVVYQQTLYSLFKAEVLGSNLYVDNVALKQYIVQDLQGIIPDRYSDPYGQSRVVFASQPMGWGTDLPTPDLGTAKLLRDGHIYILRSGRLFDLLGRSLPRFYEQ